MVMSCLQKVSPYKYQQVNVHYQTLSVRVPSSKACLSVEGVAVDKIRKCGRYIAYTALVALRWLIYQLFKIYELKSCQ